MEYALLFRCGVAGVVCRPTAEGTSLPPKCCFFSLAEYVVDESSLASSRSLYFRVFKERSLKPCSFVKGLKLNQFLTFFFF